MSRKRYKLAGKLAESLQIPKDLAYRDALFTMTGSRELVVENYKCIRRYTDTCIILKTRQGDIEIQGARLSITYYNNEEMKIAGQICRISFL